MSRPMLSWNWLAALLLAPAFVVVGCTGSSGGNDGGSQSDAGRCPPPIPVPGADGGASDGADAGTRDAAVVVVPEGASCDPETGLYWQTLPPPATYTQDQAVSACAALTLGEDTTWRLPTISELRTLVEGCEATRTGGDCQLEDPDCLIASICFDLTCGGCPAHEGPGRGGCYFDLKGRLGGPCGNTWSSSFEDGLGATGFYVLDFSDAKINRVSDTIGALARCVHKPPPLPEQP